MRLARNVWLLVLLALGSKISYRLGQDRGYAEARAVYL